MSDPAADPGRRLAFDDPSAHWTREPARIDHDGDLLHAEAVARSDWWRDTAYSFRHDDGHALVRPWAAGTAVEVAFALTGFTRQFDQAGLFIVVDDATWLKAGVEYADGHPQLGAVVTVGASDWSTGRLDEAIGRAVRMRASRIEDAVVIRARIEDADGGNPSDWRLVRVARFPHDDARIGPMLCAPTRAGFTVMFTDWRETDEDAELHVD